MSVCCGGDSGIRTRVQTRNQCAFYILILAFVFDRRQDPSHQPPAYLLNLTLASQSASASPDISAPLYPFSLMALAWSDVSFPHLVGKISDPTMLQIKQRELQCCCQLMVSDPINERNPYSVCLHTYSTCCLNQLSPKSGAKVLHILQMCKFFLQFFIFFMKTQVEKHCRQCQSKNESHPHAGSSHPEWESAE